MTPHPITVRPMTLADVPLGMRLKEIAGWNQVEADWRMFLEAGAGFVALVDGVPAGTATVVTYEARFSWIGMLLVDPAYRRRGVGTALLHAAIDHAKPFGPVYLDATPQGKPLYESLGFEAVDSLVRMLRSGQPSAFSGQPSAFSHQLAGIDVEITAISKDMSSDILHFDTPVFGAGRGAILRALLRNAPQVAHYAVRNGKIAGYCLGRSGSDYGQIGPVVADDIDAARALLKTALHACAGRDVIVDVPVGQEAWRQFLSDIDFETRRPFTRMVLGNPIGIEQPHKLFTIAGPEMG